MKKVSSNCDCDCDCEECVVMAETGQMTTANGTVNVSMVYGDPFTANFDLVAAIGAGAFSKVSKCQNRKTGEIFACKKLNLPFKDWKDPREVYAASRITNHPNILQLFEVHYAIASGRVSLVYEIMDSDIKIFTRGSRCNELLDDNIRSIMFQILSGLAHLHSHGIMHCDLKPDNVLIKLPEMLVKLGDLGNVQPIDRMLPRPQQYAATRWYRPPECILTNGYYGQEIDIWAVGCIFYELMLHEVLFVGRNEMDQFRIMHRLLGPPPLYMIQDFLTHLNKERPNHGPTSPMHQRFLIIQRMLRELELYSLSRHPLATGKDLKTEGQQNCLNAIPNPNAKFLLADFLQYDPKLRPTAQSAILYPYFKEQEREE